MQTYSRPSGVNSSSPVLRSALAFFCVASALLAAGCAGPTNTAWSSAARTTLKTVVPIPGIDEKSGFYYDGSYVDRARHAYYLGDRSIRGIDIVDTRTLQLVGQVPGIFVGQIFNGQRLNNNVSGPNALEMVGSSELWAGDGDSTVKVIDLEQRRLLATIPTGGKARTDFVVYDPDHGVVLATNKNDSPPFLSFIDPKTRRIVAKLEIPAKQVDAALYDPSQKRFLLSVGANAQNPQGEVDAIDPVRHQVVARFPTPGCFPAGLALGPSGHVLAGCSDDAIAAGFKAKSLILDANTGAILQSLDQVGGSNYVTYNPGDRRFYLGARDMTADGTKNSAKTPVLGVIDAVSMQFIENVAAAPNCKTVAADPETNRIFMPLTQSARGVGIGVFGH